MKIYFAAPFARRDELRQLRDRINTATRHRVTATWLDPRPGELDTARVGDDRYADQQREIAATDLADIDASNVLVDFADGEPCRGGHLVEFGYAIGRGLKLIVVGKRQTVFHYRSSVLAHLADGEELLEWLKTHCD